MSYSSPSIFVLGLLSIIFPFLAGQSTNVEIPTLNSFATLLNLIVLFSSDIFVFFSFFSLVDVNSIIACQYVLIFKFSFQCF
ncbi:MAG TPA: hypothetical protein DD434_13600 [Bacteroidales bacterium]|nr:hypothetical protein [Bacteroidales bacterium]